MELVSQSVRTSPHYLRRGRCR